MRPSNRMSPRETHSAPIPARETDFRAALDCYLSSILDIADMLGVVFPELSTGCLEQLSRLRARLAFEANKKTLEESCDTLHQILEGFSVSARHYTQALEEELNQTLALVAETEESRSVRNVNHVGHLVDFVDQMEKAVQSGNLAKLREQTADLRSFAESIELDTRDAFVQMRDQMREFQHRLREAELLASRDALTGVANRREFNRQLAARIEAKREFCVLFFDLDALKCFNDRFGHLYGDEILKQLGTRLSSQIRTRDFVCRWGGDEFAVILNCGLDPGLMRSQQIAQWVNRPYTVSVEGQELIVEVHVSVGIAEYLPGETSEQLFRRVDESMYRHKHGQAAG
jgi:diguanylate cyclase (GGDEF)-like protein